MQLSLESVMSLWNYVSLGNAVLAVLFLYLVNLLLVLYDFRGMPPGPRFYSIPVIGNIFSMGTKGITLRENTQSLRERYGKLFTLKLGQWKAVIVSDPESVKEVLVKKSGDFAGRPQFSSFVMCNKGYDLVMCNYGPAWKVLRKLFVSILRQFLNIGAHAEKQVVVEAQKLLQFIEEQKEIPFDPDHIFTTCTVNVISTIIFGSEYDLEHPDIVKLLQLLDKMVKDAELSKVNGFLDLFPWARFLPLPNYTKTLKLNNDYKDHLLQILKEQEKHFDPLEPAQTLLTALLKTKQELQSRSTEENDLLLSDDDIMNVATDMFAAGSETGAGTLLWAIAFLVNYPIYQKKIQEEIDKVVGRERLPNAEDRPNLPLLSATIMEVQRLGNVVDAGVPHCTMKDTTLNGYRVPKNTIVLLDLESVHLDAKCWENPEEFNPYRHIDSEGELITNQGYWLPFGAGRRGCAGEPLAKVELFLLLSIMLHQFEFLPANTESLPSLAAKKYMITKYPLSYKVKAIKRV